LADRTCVSPARPGRHGMFRAVDANRETMTADTSTPTTEPTEAPEPEHRRFRDFDIDPLIVEALEEHGITHPFPCQAMTLPVALGAHDIIGQAKTGTGKTLGFGIPMLTRTDTASEDRRPHALA